MLLEKERELLIEYGKKLVDTGLTKGTGGNLSIRKDDYIAITPSGIDFYEIEKEDIVILDIKGNIVDGTRKPSSELDMHLVTYQNRSDMNSIIHAHTTYLTVLACLRQDLKATHYMIALAGVDVKCADYATFGTKELAQNALKKMEGRNAVILANHGILAGSTDIHNAFNIVEELEYCAKIYVMAKSIGNPVILDDEEMNKMLKKFEVYGKANKK